MAPYQYVYHMEAVSKTYPGGKKCFENIHLNFLPGVKIGVVGVNGSGKSTLLRIMAGIDKDFQGEAWAAKGARVGYLPQEPQLDDSLSVRGNVMLGVADKQAILDRYNDLAMNYSDETAEEMATLQDTIDAQNLWDLDSQIDVAMEALRCPPDDAEVATLSGGEKRRVALCRLLLEAPDMLLLDEPTNHLDFAAIEWLEGLLNGYNGALLFVTHDRRFLDNVANRIVELDRGQLREYQGNFTAYQVKKAEQLEVEAAQNRKFDLFWKQEEVWIRKGIEARRTRNEGRVLRLEALRRERAARVNRLGQVGFALDAGERSGKLVAELEHVSYGYDDRPLIRDLSTRIMRGDKLGLIGPNGCGKTTLIRLILGELAPDQGRVRQGTNLQVAYFDQFRNTLDDDATLIDTIAPGSDYVEIGGQRKHIISYLEEFLFPPERARAKVSALSGGERNRLLLARLFARPANLLVLDEPTNDLDIDTLELLESLLQDYAGTVILVSHDRAFLDNVATQSLVFEGDGKLTEIAGGYGDWLAYKARQSPASAKQERTKTAPAPAKNAEKSRLSYKEAKELAAIPDQIVRLEAEQAELHGRLGDPAIYRDQPGAAIEFKARLDVIEAELLALLERWESLEQRQSAA